MAENNVSEVTRFVSSGALKMWFLHLGLFFNYKFCGTEGTVGRSWEPAAGYWGSKEGRDIQGGLQSANLINGATNRFIDPMVHRDGQRHNRITTMLFDLFV